MTRQEMVNEVTMESMRHILPILKSGTQKANATMEIIKSKLTQSTEENNQMIIAEVKNVIENADPKCFKNEGFIYTLHNIFNS